MTLNFFAAVIGAIGVCLFAWNSLLLLRALGATEEPLDGRRPDPIYAVAIGSICFALSKSYWSASLAAKGGIYVLQVVLELGFLLSLQFWLRNQSFNAPNQTQGLILPLFLFAIGLVNHWPTQTLLIPALFLAYATHRLTTESQEFFSKHLSRPWIAAIAGLTTLSLYLYLPLRAHLLPALDFGHPDNFHRFFKSLLRIFYFKRETLASFLPTASATILDKSLYISNHLIGDYNLFFDLAALAGLWALKKKGLNTQVVFLLFGLLATLMANAIYLQVTPIDYWHMDDHLLTLNWILGLLGTIGVYQILSLMRNRRLLNILSHTLFTLIPLSMFLSHLPWNDQKRETLFRDYGVEILKSMERGTFYIAESDYDYFSILYLQKAEGKRPDVGMQLVTFLKTADWENLKQGLAPGDASINRPLYCAFPNGDFINTYLRQKSGISLKPRGILMEINPPSTKRVEKVLTQPLEDLWGKTLIPNRRSFNPINGLLQNLCAHPYINMALYLGARGQWDNWGDYFVRALGLITDLRWRAETWANKAEGDLQRDEKGRAVQDFLGAYSDYLTIGMVTEAQVMLEKASVLDPHLGHPTTPSTPNH